jgi:hypothetical protein
MVSVMETLIRPLRRLPAAHGTVLAFYREFPNLVAAPVDLDVAAEAANLRVAFGLAAPGAATLRCPAPPPRRAARSPGTA